MSIRLIAFAFLSCFFTFSAHAQRGKQGNISLTQTSPGPNYTVNEYTRLLADATAGQTTLTVLNASLNTNNRFPAALGAGDLLLLIQMQGASISTPDDSTYGAVTNYNGSGNQEWIEVRSIDASNNTIELSCGLQKNYMASGRVQVIRVPRYNTLTVQSNARITCPAWNGSTGGIVVIETNSDLTLQSNASIDVSALGFRGGSKGNLSSLFGGVNFLSTNEVVGAEKGEGIAGSVTDYDVNGGRYCRGAAANGGGGGNSHNSGGGGGANAGNPALWSGLGNPSLTTANWAQAWNLEYVGFANSTSTGGGKGGYSFSSLNLNALTAGTFNSAWDGDWRRNNGGLGGHPADYTTGSMYMGGGGGGGEQNNGYGGNGGNGGGIILVRSYASVVGSGKLLANGANGVGSIGSSPFVSGTDGSGGGGAGGSIRVEAVGTIANLTLEAKGGNGGSQDVLAFVNEAEGPGGGGGGGYIALSNTVSTATVAGGANGTTDSNALTEFTPNGATRGGAGEIALVPTLNNLQALSDTLCGPGTAVLTALNTANSAVYWAASPCGISLESTASFSVTVSGPTNYYLSSCELAQTIPSNVNFSPAPTVDAGPVLFLCGGQSGTLVGTGSGTLSWLSDPSLSDSSLSNPVVTPADTTQYFLTVTDSNGCLAMDSVLVNVGDYLNLTISDSAVICPGSSLLLAVSGADTYVWQSDPALDTSIPEAPVASPVSSSTYYVSASTAGGCTAQDSVHVDVYASVPLSLSGGGLYCNTAGAEISASGANTLLWQPATGLSDPTFLTTLATPSDSTWYHATATDVNGCWMTTTDSVLVYPGLLPVAGFTFNQISNFEVVFTNTSTNVEQTFWTINGVEFTTTDCTFNFPFDATYPIKLIVENSCGSDTITTTIDVIKIVGIEDVVSHQLKLYPNPAQEQIVVQNPFQNGHEAVLFMYDSRGSLTGKFVLRQSQWTINLEDVAAGLYTVIVQQGTVRYTSRLMHD